MNKDKIRDMMQNFKEFFAKRAWPVLKGVIIVLFGLYITRASVGAGRFETNAMYGMLAYLFLAVSGQLIVRNLQTSSKLNLILSGTMYAIGFAITLIIMAIFNLEIIILIPLISIGALWIVLLFYASSKSKEELIIKLLTCLVFTIGLIYGASLNQVFFPIIIFTFFFTLFFLQLSREYIKEFREVEGIKKIKKNRFKKFRKNLGSKIKKTPSKETIKENLRKSSVKARIDTPQSKDILKKSFYSQIFAIIMIGVNFIILIITMLIGGTAYPLMFLWIMIIYLVFMGLAALFTQKSISKSGIPKRSGLFISFSMLLMLLAILFST